MSEANILLETGTNEFEFAEFLVKESRFGINVSKVREFIKEPELVQVPEAHPSVKGVFNLRGNIIMLIDLEKHLKLNYNDTLQQTNTNVSLTKQKKINKKIAIVTEFNNRMSSFLVDQIEGIHRETWEKIVPMHQSGGEQQSAVVGSVRINEKIILLLDFEKILADIMPETAIKSSKLESEFNKVRRRFKVLLAEDSPTVRAFLAKTITEAGYSVEAYENGKVALAQLKKYATYSDPIKHYVNVIVSDIEMPQMDGHHFIKNIKDDPKLNELPIIIFSSISNDMIKERGLILGADVQISKPDIDKVVDFCDRLVGISNFNL